MKISGKSSKESITKPISSPSIDNNPKNSHLLDWKAQNKLKTIINHFVARNSKIVGILNLTPDSFFDGGRYNQEISALKQIENLIAQGANIIDIGAQSTRPDALIISPNQEWQRLEAILPQAIKLVAKHNQKNQINIKISLDSNNHQTVSKALKLGIDIINDVGGFDNLNMANLAAASGKKLVVMHNLGAPADKNKIIDPKLNVVAEVFDWMQKKIKWLNGLGIEKSQIIFDIGLGFGKNADQSIELLSAIDQFKNLGLPLYVGHSNKSFLDNAGVFRLFNCEIMAVISAMFKQNFPKESNKNLNLPSICQQFLENLSNQNLKTREEKTLAISLYLAYKNVEFIRLHL